MRIIKDLIEMIIPHKTEISVEEALLKYNVTLPGDFSSIQTKISEDEESSIENKKKRGCE
jgi:hypothetical protein